MNIIQFLDRQPKRLVFAGGAAAVVGLGFIDYIIGPEIAFSIFYLFPISAIVWHVGPRAGLFIAVEATVAWFLSHAAAGESYVHQAIPYWNAAMRLGIFVIVVSLLAKLKDINVHLEDKVKEKTASLSAEIDERKRLEKSLHGVIQELQEALARVKTLHCLLPICAWCKKIRDDNGYWHQVEVYMKEHAGADFSHGICPECAEKRKP